MGPDRLGRETLKVGVAQGLGECVRVARGTSTPVSPLMTVLGAAGVGGYDWASGGLGLDGGDAELLDIGDDEGEGSGVEGGGARCR